ncbi:MAG: Ku protein [Bacteroidia bacterium]|nr:Ku protein [Bacteroidia bacterium]
MRSVWKGHIRFSLVTIPILVYNAVESKSTIRFNQLHKKDNGRIGYVKTCKSCDEEVGRSDIVKGYEYAPDQFVVFENEELDSIKLKSNRAIDIETFVDIKEVHPSRYEAVYYVGPDGEVAKKTFNLLIKTLKMSNRAGIGRIILRDKEDVVLLAPYKKAIIMYKLRYPEELRDVNDVPHLGEEDVDEAQLRLAETLVDSLKTPFSKVDFEDRYKEALMDLVNEKVSGKEIVTVTEEEEDGPVVDIMDALKKSIELAKSVKKGA